MLYGALGLNIGRLRKQLAEEAGQTPAANTTDSRAERASPPSDEAVRQVEILEEQARFWRWTGHEMAELARQAVAKYGNAKSPPASPMLDTHLIMEMYERKASRFAALSTPRQPGESILAYQDRLLAVSHQRRDRRRLNWLLEGPH